MIENRKTCALRTKSMAFTDFASKHEKLLLLMQDFTNSAKSGFPPMICSRMYENGEKHRTREILPNMNPKTLQTQAELP